MSAHRDDQPAAQPDDAVERALAALTPRPARLDRDWLMFRAGQASVERLAALPAGAPLRSDPGHPPLCFDPDHPPVRSGLGHLRLVRAGLWPAATAVSTLIAVALGMLLVLRPAGQVIREIESVDRPVPAAPDAAQDADPLRALRAADTVAGTGDNVAGVDEGVAGVGAQRSPQPGAPGLPLPRDPTQPTTGPNYLQLRELVLSQGVEAWQASFAQGEAAPSSPSTYREMLRSLLEEQGARRVEPARQPFLDWTIFFDRGENL